MGLSQCQHMFGAPLISRRSEYQFKSDREKTERNDLLFIRTKKGDNCNQGWIHKSVKGWPLPDFAKERLQELYTSLL